MSKETWTAVDTFFCDHLVPSDDALDAALAASDAAGLPHINVAPNQGKLLHLIARLHGARKILEIGTLGGYSTIWLGRALPADGSLITLEYAPKHAEVARENIARAGLTNVDVRVGKAIDTLPTLTGEAPFDLIFIDADKQSNPDYFGWAMKLSRPGTIIVVDNVVRAGAVADADSAAADIQGTRRVIELMGQETRVTATAIQTVGSKGYDGFAIGIVTD